MRFSIRTGHIRDHVVTTVDLTATFILAVECALTAVRADFDLFGILMLAFVGSTGGGVIRDLLLGEHPPAALRDWRYAALAVAATGTLVVATFVLGRVGDFTPPFEVDVFEGAGLSLAAVAGARKSMDYKLNAPSVVAIATINGCGGGILRDLLSAQIPHVLHEDFYATAALAGAVVMVVLARRSPLSKSAAVTIGGVTIFALRTAAILQDWRLPHLR